MQPNHGITTKAFTARSKEIHVKAPGIAMGNINYPAAFPYQH